MGAVLLLTDEVASRRRDELLRLAPDLELLELVGDAEFSEEQLASITHAFFSADTWPNRSTPFLRACLAAPNLRWFQSFSAGGDHPVFGRFADRGVEVLFTPGGSAPSIAQTVMMMVLALVRGLPEMLEAQRRKEWTPTETRDLGDVSVGIIGMGSIGAEVARLIGVTGADVVGVRRTPTGTEPCETWSDERRDELISRSDVVVLCMPLTDATRQSIGKLEFAMMRPGTIVINVGRGECVDESALIDALNSGHLAGAGLDVFATEPLPDDSPLWTMPRVIVSPHSSGLTNRSLRRAEDAFVANLAQTLRAEANDISATR